MSKHNPKLGPRTVGPQLRSQDESPLSTPTTPRVENTAQESPPELNSLAATGAVELLQGSTPEHRLWSEEHVGAPDLGLAEIERFPELVLVRHIYARMAVKTDRSAEIERLKELLYNLNDGRRVRRILERLFEVGRFVNIYPLELMDALVKHSEGFLPKVRRREVIINRAYIESRLFDVEAPIPFEFPLNAQVRGFALSGGGSYPGYCFQPGPPGRYELEFGAEGRFDVLVLARVRGTDCIDRVRVWVEDGN